MKDGAGSGHIREYVLPTGGKESRLESGTAMSHSMPPVSIYRHWGNFAVMVPVRLLNMA